MPFSGTEHARGKLLEAIYNKWKWVAEDPNHELRIVLYSGSPNPVNPDESWLKATVKFKEDYDKFEKGLATTRFTDGSVNNEQVKIYGAITQIRFMDADYPMNDLHYFD